MFECETGDRCISLSARCDGITNCPDSEDERGCGKLNLIICSRKRSFYTFRRFMMPNSGTLQSGSKDLVGSSDNSDWAI